MSKLDYSQITEQLYVGKTPYGKDYGRLHELGVVLIINMRAEWPSKLLSRQKQIKEVWFPSLDSIYFPLNQKKLLANAEMASSVINNGGKVYVYCKKGRHRSVAMAAAILILQGQDIKSISKLFTTKRTIADMNAKQVMSALSIFKERLKQ